MKKNRKLNKKDFPQKIFFLIIIFYLLLNIINVNLEIIQQENEFNSLKKEYLEKEIKLEDAKQKTQISDEEYMEKYARDNMNYIYPGDSIFYCY